MVTDVTGFPLAIDIQPANTQDRDGALDVIQQAHDKYETLQKVWADSGYAGTCQTEVFNATGVEVEIVRRSDDVPLYMWLRDGQEPPEAVGFKVIRRRWVIERTFGWIGRFRRNSKDYEKTPASSLAWVRLALVAMLVRRLAAR